MPHTQGALGYTMQTPEEERYLMDRDEIYAEIRTMLGGRAAEKVAFNTMTTGASNDIERATDLARKMITMYGMSDKFGVMGLATIQNQYLDGQMGLTCAQDTAAQVDTEIHKVLERCFAEAVEILENNRAPARRDLQLPADQGDHHRRGDDVHYPQRAPRGHRG